MNATISRSLLNINVEVKSRFFKLNGRKIKISRVLEESKHNELKYKTLIEHFPDAIFSVDLRGNIIGANIAAENITGYIKEELLRMSFLTLITFEKVGKNIDFIKIVKKTFVTKRITIKHKDGHYIQTTFTCFPIVIENKTTGLYVITKDVTKNAFCLEEMSRLQKMIDNSIDMISLSEITKRGEIRIVNVNHYFCKKLGFDKNELSFMSYSDLYAKKKVHLERLLKKLFSEKQVKIRTYFVKKNGERLHVDVYICLFEINGQKFIQTVARDILEFEEGDNENLDRGTKLRMLMSKKNINTSELAEMTGLSPATISNLRTGKVTQTAYWDSQINRR